MTTEVIVKANHGWPVRVTRINAGVPIDFESIVEAGTAGSFHVWDGSDLLVHEIQPVEPSPQPDFVTSRPDVEPILQFFEFGHLPPHLQAVSEPFYHLAHTIVLTLARNQERTVALRKLLEAKDAAVRARVFV